MFSFYHIASHGITFLTSLFIYHITHESLHDSHHELCFTMLRFMQPGFKDVAYKVLQMPVCHPGSVYNPCLFTVNHSLHSLHSPTHPLTDSLTHLLPPSLAHSLTHTLTYPSVCLLTHSLTHSLTHPPTHSVSQSSSDSVTQSVIVSISQ